MVLHVHKYTFFQCPKKKTIDPFIYDKYLMTGHINLSWWHSRCTIIKSVTYNLIEQFCCATKSNGQLYDLIYLCSDIPHLWQMERRATINMLLLGLFDMQYPTRNLQSLLVGCCPFDSLIFYTFILFLYLYI